MGCGTCPRARKLRLGPATPPFSGRPVLIVLLQAGGDGPPTHTHIHTYIHSYVYIKGLIPTP
ncbi:hypothetical protein HanIR_Chr12g0568621 [Helianthus annuus]|nr:hypothetical protein HanIR_Chr12g0568621 [Helianthus annuus]